jgi:hypothetical protein
MVFRNRLVVPRRRQAFVAAPLPAHASVLGLKWELRRTLYYRYDTVCPPVVCIDGLVVSVKGTSY